MLRILGLLLCLAAPAAAAPLCGDTGACLKVIEGAQKSTRVLSAKFQQTKHVSLLAEPIVSSGQFGFRQPDQVVWRSEDPPLVIRISKERVELPPAVEREAGAQGKALTSALQQVSQLLSGSLQNLGGLFELQAKQDGEEIGVHLVPRPAPMRELFAAIDMTFAAPHFVLSKIVIAESLGDQLEITFSDFHRNDAEAEAVFAR